MVCLRQVTGLENWRRTLLSIVISHSRPLRNVLTRRYRLVFTILLRYHFGLRIYVVRDAFQTTHASTRCPSQEFAPSSIR